MYKLIAATILVLLLSSALFSQETYSDKLSWKENLSKTNENQEVQEFLYFENANLDDQSFLPFYSNLIDINHLQADNYKYDVQLTNMVFEPINKSKLQGVANLNLIKQNINVVAEEYFSQQKLYLQFSFVPIRRNAQTNELERLVSFDYQLVKSTLKRTAKKLAKKYAQNSVLSSGNWYKIAINQTGIYKLTFEQLTALGIANPQNVRVFGNGEGLLSTQNATERIDDLKELKIKKNSDHILFYAKGPTRWDYSSTIQMFLPTLHKFSDYAYYFITSDYNSGFDNQIATMPQITDPASETIQQFTDYYFHERELENLIESGSSWVGEKFDAQLEYDFNINFPNIVNASEIKLKSVVAARSFAVSSFTLSIDNYTSLMSVPATSVSETAPYAQALTKIHTFASSGNSNLNLNLKYTKSSASSEAWLDNIVLNARRELIFSGSQMPFRYFNITAQEKVCELIVGNTTETMSVWNVTDMHNVQAIATNFNGGKSYFKQKNNKTLEFVAFNGSSFLTPITQGTGLGKVENQNLHALEQTDYIIIANPKFYAQANDLKNYYQQTTNLHVTLVKPEQIYNEFSSGAVDVSALRDFVRMFYNRAQTQGKYPRYLLLFGNGSYDNVGRIAGSTNSNYILTYQSENSVSPTSSFVSDDFFGLLDENEGDYTGLLDIGIGRFPVETTQQAELLVSKTKHYNSAASFGSWQNNITFVADDGDDNNGNIHLNHGEGLSDKVRLLHPEYNITKLYIGAYNQESTAGGSTSVGINQGVEDALNKGTLIFNYNGHGNESTLAHEKVIDIGIIRSWKNKDKLAVFMTATCEFSRFDDWEIVTAGEEILLNPDGGGVALFSTTRLVYASPNYTLNNKFYDFIFENDDNNEQYRLGEVMQRTKNTSGSGINKLNFTLLGDPALQIAIPKYKVLTTSINEKTVGQDTLKAAEEVRISGEIVNSQNLKLTSLNGTLNLTVFDKFMTQQTLGQDGAPIVDFQVQKNVLYNGIATVKNGEFSIAFIVPKDISYKFGFGKFSYYALFDDFPATGYSNQIVIGGFSQNPVSSNENIDLELYMNDSTFVSGGITNQSPKLLVYINSNTGINTVGNGIGHDITAVLDNDTRNSFILNDFYQSEKDTYKKGRIEYPFTNVAAGNHSLNLKVWDVLNNSTTADIEFLVIEDSELTIDKLFNYPNPFTNTTWFYFTHNQANSNLDVSIQIFTVSGKLVKNIEQTINVQSFLSEGIFWDGLDDFGDKIGRGVYFYKLKVKNENDDEVEKIEKLLILK